MFDIRKPGVGIMFGGSYNPPSPLKDQVEDGDTVELRIGVERIQVEGVSRSSNGSYKGTIRGFEPSFSVEFQGLKLGQVVEFDHDQIHACSSMA